MISYTISLYLYQFKCEYIQITNNYLANQLYVYVSIAYQVC